MGRLIDVDELKKNIAKWLKPSSPDESEMVAVDDIAISVMIEIEEQPTAYDVDRVIKRISNDKEHTIYGCINKYEAIEIVKEGAVKDE